jgi:nitrate/nitrite-specific signal transduction histidine kinase
MRNRTPEVVAASEMGCPQPPASAEDTARILDDRIRALEAGRARLEQKVLELRTEQQHLLERYVGLEEQNSFLTTLYVAGQRLHSTLDRAEVLQTVREIIANLVGCEEYALFRLQPDGVLHRVDSFGVVPEAYETVLPGHGLIGRTVETGEVYLVGEGDGRAATEMDANLTACVPLKRNGAVTGAIALFRLLPQKLALLELDHELFRLLETHLAMALHCTELQEKASTRNGVEA